MYLIIGCDDLTSFGKILFCLLEAVINFRNWFIRFQVWIGIHWQFVGKHINILKIFIWRLLFRRYFRFYWKRNCLLYLVRLLWFKYWINCCRVKPSWFAGFKLILKCFVIKFRNFNFPRLGRQFVFKELLLFISFLILSRSI